MFAYYLAGSEYIVNPLLFGWANVILYTFWGIVLFPANKVPYWRDGYISMFVVMTVMFGLLWVVLWLDRRTAKQYPDAAAFDTAEVVVATGDEKPEQVKIVPKVERPWLRYCANQDTSTEWNLEIDEGLALVCKQVYQETQPCIRAALDLHVVYSLSAPQQLAQLPDRDLRKDIRNVIFHIAAPSEQMRMFCYDRPPKRPFKLHRFPNLDTFTVWVPIHVPIQELIPPPSRTGSSRLRTTFYDLMPGWQESEEASEEHLEMACATCCAMRKKEKAALWRNRYGAQELIDFVSRFGRGGWLSRIVDPERHPEPLTLDPDDDPENMGSEWDAYDEDGEGQYGDDVDDDPNRLDKLRAIAANMHVMIECEFWATRPGENHNGDMTNNVDGRPALSSLTIEVYYSIKHTDAESSRPKRRRLNFACNYCRSRKTRCYEGHPSCRAYTDAGVACVTQDR
ncbi:uncharacterized protein B0I36DRAFT_364278 [Microdochium trichocladiopsis]|uniref:Zn(2)-C6 fungal-type domain-containing protein n=1 Tax=Microdochium trichocladiopsis TaxID=1682393 RepID=A0A9P9BQ13_9PEZI|nr:uncharacterized protein B0I36DRAFT_364278 [Microdochium trichocladiopsis]KAH7029802.1 hypothetical protein B0I36DRAFT_364278 [Microdochium trichocladiopsis]